jgi:hypothetical protein
LDENNKVDKDVKKHINNLKSRVKKCLPATNIHEFKVNYIELLNFI